MAERVWDRFLTEQDKGSLQHKEPKKIGFGQNPALLLIDLYRWVFGDKPEPLLEAIKTWPGSCGMAAWEALPYIQEILAQTREIDTPVNHLTGIDGGKLERLPFCPRRGQPRPLTERPAT